MLSQTVCFSVYRPQMKLWKGNVFTPVSHSVHRGGGHAWQWVCMARGIHGREGMAGGMCVAGEMATAVDGTHPTGMHSCCILSSIKLLLQEHKWI